MQFSYKGHLICTQSCEGGWELHVYNASGTKYFGCVETNLGIEKVTPQLDALIAGTPEAC